MNFRRKARIEQRKKLQTWSKNIRSAGHCEVCSTTVNLDAHHILPKEMWKHLKFELWNGVCLCKKCHKFGRFSAHKNPIWFAYWLKTNQPEKYEKILSIIKLEYPNIENAKKIS